MVRSNVPPGMEEYEGTYIHPNGAPDRVIYTDSKGKKHIITNPNRPVNFGTDPWKKSDGEMQIDRIEAGYSGRSLDGKILVIPEMSIEDTKAELERQVSLAYKKDKGPVNNGWASKREKALCYIAAALTVPVVVYTVADIASRDIVGESISIVLSEMYNNLVQSF